MMCFRCTKIAIIVFYGFRLLSAFFFAPMPSTTLNICAAIFISCTSGGGEGNAADTPELLLPFRNFYDHVELRFLQAIQPHFPFGIDSTFPATNLLSFTFSLPQTCKFYRFHDNFVFRPLVRFPQFRSVLFVAAGFIVTLLCIQIPLGAAYLSAPFSSATAMKPNRII